ncbi:sugar ABC transporter ATP-binding protein [Rhizobium sp. P32RR-XVIII]|uniref:sugar ABC transporter ATP-binding protein n=1 Tax=Rhizobium sp. P32RR-XVIII TaxID=2726738 RepID=UPI001456DC1D|nr:sugar ABC transporter ATP-binding protein [Rhizobium sp. P32RR-XVIII]NLS07244.1 sugar ABC transporter ATP-binding protein [Rhizobium sp. P32RR-XVIII]
MQIVAEDIERSFGNTRALSGVSLTLRAGRIHALVGENGAGKSTLMKILAGAERPDAGSMTIDGDRYAPRNAACARERGVGLVFQEMTINPALSIAENIFTGQFARYRRNGFLNYQKLQQDAQALLDGFSAEISVRQPLNKLDLGQWKCIEVARALSTSPRAVLFDESTAFLNHREVNLVLGAMRALKAQGLIVAFVSHHLAEVEEVADALTILKDGLKVGDFAAGDLDRDQIQSRMVGRDLSKGLYPQRAITRSKQERLRLDNIVTDRHEPVSLSVMEGEIVGIGGLKGAGGERLLEVAAGAVKPASGKVVLEGQQKSFASPADAWRSGIAYLPGDRTAEGLIVDASVLDNLVMAKPPRRGPLFDRKKANALAQSLIERLTIKTSSASARSGSLSGGNLQKVVLGKCLAIVPRVLLLNNPTRGVDIGARVEIYRSLREAAASGLAILVVSEDLNELIGLSDRIVVMRGGCVSAEIDDPAATTEDVVIRSMI